MSKKNVEWEWKKLGDVCEVQGGATPLKSNKDFWENGNNPWLTIDDIREQGRIINYTKQHITNLALKKTRVFPAKSILLCCTASVGEYAMTNIALSSNQQFNALSIRDKKQLIPEFLLHFCRTLKETLLDLSEKATIDFVSSTKVKNINIPIPPLDEQERIVKVLDDAFEKIDAIKTTAETNLQNAKEVFNAALSHEFDKTKFRTEKLSVCTYIRPPKNETIKGLKQTSTVSFLPMEDLGIRTRSISAIKSKLLSEVEGSYTCFANNDVLLAKVTPCFENGKMGIAENLVNGVGFGSSEYIVFRPSQNVDNVYLFYFLMTKDFVNEGKKQMLGACGLKRLSKDYVANTQIPLPPLPIQKQIVTKLDSLSEKVKQLESNYKQVLADCDELKKALLKQAFEGML